MQARVVREGRSTEYRRAPVSPVGEPMPTRRSLSRLSTKAMCPIEKGNRHMRRDDPAAQKAPPERTAPKRRKHNKTIRRPAAAAFPPTRTQPKTVAAARHRKRARLP